MSAELRAELRAELVAELREVLTLAAMVAFYPTESAMRDGRTICVGVPRARMLELRAAMRKAGMVGTS